MTQHHPPQPPPHGAYPPPYATQAPPKKKRRWPWIVGAIVLLFIVVGVANGGGGQATQNTPGVASGVTSGSGGAVAQAPAQQEAQQQAPAQLAGSFGPGTHEVGVDIQPGKYKTQGGGVGGSCYWARLKNTDGDFDSIITNGNAQGPTTVTISKTDGAFETTCESWTKAD